MEIFSHSLGEHWKNARWRNKRMPLIDVAAIPHELEVDRLLEIAGHAEVQGWRAVCDFVDGLCVEVLH